jgi:hypothetical protein
MVKTFCDRAAGILNKTVYWRAHCVQCINFRLDSQRRQQCEWHATHSNPWRAHILHIGSLHSVHSLNASRSNWHVSMAHFTVPIFVLVFDKSATLIYI